MNKLLYTTLLLLFFQVLHAQNWTKFQSIEKISSSDPKELSEKITTPFESEKDKLAAIYYWIAHNIKYDVQKFEKIIGGKMDGGRYTEEEILKKIEKETLAALKRKKGVCQDYSYLFKKLAMQAGFECEYISGYGKSDFLRTNGLGISHAWNAVKLDGKWEVLDVTWGAGYLDESRKFIFRFDPGYFMPNVIAFTSNHFPKEEKWQLVDNPISKAEYKNRPVLGGGYYSFGIHNFQPNESEVIINKTDGYSFTFSAEKDIDDLVCYNILRGRKEKLTVRKEDGMYHVHVHVNRSGFYMFRQLNDIFFTQRIKVK